MYWAEFTHLTFLAIAITFFAVAFIGFLKIVGAKVQIPGLHQAFASAA